MKRLAGIFESVEDWEGWVGLQLEFHRHVRHCLYFESIMILVSMNLLKSVGLLGLVIGDSETTCKANCNGMLNDAPRFMKQILHLELALLCVVRQIILTTMLPSRVNLAPTCIRLLQDNEAEGRIVAGKRKMAEISVVYKTSTMLKDSFSTKEEQILLLILFLRMPTLGLLQLAPDTLFGHSIHRV
ncbi:hypothetical protein C5167_026830 [Papaver somniferum]|nr:hypothetical protein C5167_026830 [Papaver somniferum]